MRTGAFFSILWVAFWIGVITRDTPSFKDLSYNEIGDFLAGTIGPLALLWVVLGYLQQGRELRNSIDALNLQAKELKRSAELQRRVAEINNRVAEFEESKFKSEVLLESAKLNAEVRALMDEIPGKAAESRNNISRRFPSRTPGDMNSEKWKLSISSVNKIVSDVTKEYEKVTDTSAGDTPEVMALKLAALYELKIKLHRALRDIGKH